MKHLCVGGLYHLMKFGKTTDGQEVMVCSRCGEWTPL